jgi:hypothetical protein
LASRSYRSTYTLSGSHLEDTKPCARTMHHVQARSKALFVVATLAISCALVTPARATQLDVSEDFVSTPIGKCATIAPGTPPYRSSTSRTADTHRKIGTSGEGRPIWAEHWGTPTGPQVLVIGQIHGDECSPAFLVEAIRQKAPTKFGLWLIPTLNPDALAKGSRFTPNGVDINRDGYALRTPEARALMAFTRSVKPVLTVHIHSPYGFVGSRNGGVATNAANAIARASGWSQWQGSGTLAGSRGNRGFLWDGQERVLARHRSILIELPATSKLEAAGAPQPARRVITTPAKLRTLASRIRDALYASVTTKPTR